LTGVERVSARFAAICSLMLMRDMPGTGSVVDVSGAPVLVLTVLGVVVGRVSAF
jgi:hypothetical protein